MSEDKDHLKPTDTDKTQTEVERSIVVSDYQKGLDQLSGEFGDIGKERLKKLLTSGAVALKHFFAGKYGIPDENSSDMTPVYWSYVRFLAYDALRPQFGHGKTNYANQNYGKDKFLQDIAEEANAITRILPQDLNHKEWIFLTKVWSHMMMSDPYLVESGYITPKGRENLMSNALMAGPSDEMYVARFNYWKKQYSTGLRDNIIDGEVVE